MAASERRQHLDYDLIVDLVERGSSVLDLGCGDGELLLRLRDFKSVHGLGVEIEEAMIFRCLARGITVFQGNLNDGLRDHASGSYDYVVLNQTLQQIDRPLELLAEMLRVGRQVIVSFPNFGYLGIRLSLLLRGRMPASRDPPVRMARHAEHPPVHPQRLPGLLPGEPCGGDLRHRHQARPPHRPRGRQSARHPGCSSSSEVTRDRLPRIGRSRATGAGSSHGPRTVVWSRQRRRFPPKEAYWSRISG